MPGTGSRRRDRHRRRAVGAAGATLLALTLAGVAVAGTEEKGRATAALVTSTRGDVGVVRAEGSGRQGHTGAVALDAVSAASGEAAASVDQGGSRATVVVRSVEVLGGLVRAYGVRYTAEADPGASVRTGRVEGLVVDGKVIGTVEAPGSYELGDGLGSVSVLQGDAGLRVALRRSYRGFPRGTVVQVAQATARAGTATPDALVSPDERPRSTTPPAQDETKPSRTERKRTPARRAKVRRAPKVQVKLTGQRFAFPVAGAAGVADDFGGPRQIGPHQGNDIYAPEGTPVVAVTDGTLDRVGTLRISGNRLWLRSPGGDEFFYAHLSAFSPAARNGSAVRAGTVIGFVGTTGDAEGTAPHLHFEIHPAGERAVDPHRFLASWQRRLDVPPGAWLVPGLGARERPGTLTEVRDFIATR